MPHPTSPALNAHHSITGAQHTKLDGIHDAPLQTAVNILLPGDFIEVGLPFGEEERVDAAVEMGVAGRAAVASDHDDRAHGTVFGEQAGGFAAWDWSASSLGKRAYR